MLKHAALILFSLASPAAAWQFSPTPICTLTDGTTTLTYDGATYTIAITRSEGWTPAPVFSIRFDGPNALQISTDRHQIKGTTLTVSDRGFGNVLNGLQFNQTATATLGQTSQVIDLSGASGPTAQFRACKPSPSV